MSDQEIINKIIELLNGKSFQESKDIIYAAKDEVAKKSILNPVG